MIVADNVMQYARDVFAGRELAFEDVPSYMPPFPRFFIEARLPADLRSWPSMGESFGWACYSTRDDGGCRCT